MDWVKFNLPPAYYKEDWVYIINADFRDVLPHIPDKSIDLVLTDPPYGVERASWDNEFSNDWIEGIERLCGEDSTLISFCGTKQFPYLAIEIDKYFPERNYLVWYCPNKNFYSPRHLIIKTEQAIIARRGYPYFNNEHNYLDIITTNKETELNGHPSQKPFELIGKIVTTFSDRDNLILDPFLGSGTTAYCAKKLNRHCIGIEIEEKYCEIAANRCSQQVFDFREETSKGKRNVD